MKKATILGIQFDITSLEQAVEYAMSQINGKHHGYVVTPNAEIAYLCKNDQALTHIINNASLVLPDGIGIVYASKILKQGIQTKVAGIDFADALMCQMEKAGKSVFFLGAKPGVAEQAANNLKKKYPALIVSGVHDGYFQNEEEAVQAINQAGETDVAFICLGAPKQEQFISAHLHEIQATLLCGFGGSLDVFAGTVQRAPDIFIKLGLEWFYRLLKEPKRIGRMMNLPKFLFAVLKLRFLGKPKVSEYNRKQ